MKIALTGVGYHGRTGGIKEARAAVAAGRSVVEMHPLADVDGAPSIPCAPATAVPDPYLRDRKLIKYMSPATRMAVVAAGRALESARLRVGDPELIRAGLFMNVGLIAFDFRMIAEAMQSVRDEEGAGKPSRGGAEALRRCHPLLPFQMLLNMPLGLVSIAFGLHGENSIVYPSPGQARENLEEAIRGIRAGRFERALVGSTAQQVSLLPVCTLRRLGRLAATPEAAIPGTQAHAGFAPADGAAFLVLESEAAARQRGVRPLAFLERTAAGRPSSSMPANPVEERVACWVRAANGGAPERVISTGSLDAAEDRADTDAARRMGSTSAPRVVWLDGVLGHSGASSLLGAVAVGSSWLGPEAPRVLAVSNDPDGPRCAVALAAAEAAA